MQKRISTLPFQGTKEQQEQLFKVIDENGGTHGSVMPILQKAQEIYGYLPIEVQTMIAEKMDSSRPACDDARRVPQQVA